MTHEVPLFAALADAPATLPSQEEVLDEYFAGRKDELQRLVKFREELEIYVVRSAPPPTLHSARDVT